MTGLEVAPSSIVGFRYQLKREAGGIYKKLIDSLKHSKFTHWDKTGTKIKGNNAWRWKVSNKKICVTHTDKRRASSNHLLDINGVWRGGTSDPQKNDYSF